MGFFTQQTYDFLIQQTEDFLLSTKDYGHERARARKRARQKPPP
jgi:hypothetical protein